MSTRAEDVKMIASNAIAANWRARNARVVCDESRHERMKKQSRGQLREWLAVLRIASDPGNVEFIRARLRDSGPLAAYDLRNRVIIAGLDRRIDRAVAIGLQP